MNRCGHWIGCFLALMGAAALTGADFLLPAENPLGMRTYTQTVELTYPDAAAAGSAALTAAPLPYGKKLAVSCRWDDTNPSHVRMHDLMVKHGFRGTFYLCDLNASSGKSWFKGYLEKLREGGCTVGAHGMKHANLRDLAAKDPNGVFRELGASRAQLEAAIDAPVNTHAFAYGAYSKKGEPAIGRTIADTYTRCGFTHDTYSGFPVSTQGLRQSDISSEGRIQPGDRDTKAEKFAEHVAKGIANEKAMKVNPNLTVGVHTWQKGRDWEELEAGFAQHAGRPDWWYCTNNEYGAYRYEFHHARIEKVSTQGNKVVWKITRMVPAELGSSVPLFLESPGATAATVDGRTVKLAQPGVLALEHSPEQRIPEQISWLSNPENRADFAAPAKLAGVSAGLWFDAGSGALMLKLDNRSGAVLKNPALTVRLPLAWSPGVLRRQLEDLPAGVRTIRIDLPARRAELGERPFFWCELDYDGPSGRGRIHATCNR